VQMGANKGLSFAADEPVLTYLPLVMK